MRDQIFLALIVLLFGLATGSFLNVLIYRLPRGLHPSKGFSFCPACAHRLGPIDLIPLGSYLALGGKCRYCHTRISPVYPVVELSNALLWVAVAWQHGFRPQALAYMVACSCLLAIVFTDWQCMIIPDSLAAVIGAAGVVLLCVFPLFRIDRLIGMVCVSVPLLLIALLSKERAMGGGDIKLTAALGLVLGWRLTLLSVMLGAVLGTLVMLLLRRTKYALGREVPFGCFICIGALVSVLCGTPLLHWYFSHL